MSRFSSPRVKEGHIQLIFGPMFSGKTTEMMRRINRYRLANRVCRVVKYKNDTRYDENKIATHDMQMHSSLSALKISEVWDDLMIAQVIGIDEGQFFEDIVKCSENLANTGKVVIIAALDGDFNRKRFRNNILDLCPMSECVTKLTAVCTKCGEDAAFTFRLSSDLKQEVIGGQEMYTAHCRNCYNGASKKYICLDGEAQPFKRSHGRIELIFGPMFSGKSTELLRRRNRHALAGRKCRVIKYADGHKLHPDKVVTHDELVYEAVTATSLKDNYDKLADCEVVLIDDGQFFPDVVEFSERLANSGKIVIVSALDGDYNRKEFSNRILDLCPLAEAVTKLCAVCSCCDNDAAFSRKIAECDNLDGMYSKKNIYRAMCRTCYMEASKKSFATPRSVLSPLKENLIQKRQPSEEEDVDVVKNCSVGFDAVMPLSGFISLRE